MERCKINLSAFNNNDNVNIDLGISEDFSTNLNQNSLYNEEYLEKVKDENVNKIVDYEKYQFIPSYYSKRFYGTTDHYGINEDGLAELNTTIGGKQTKTTNLDKYAHNIEQINFNVHFRKRDDYDTWEVKEGTYWNIWDGTDNKPTEGNSILGYGDLLGDLGFTDEDVLYQKNALKKSFLRIAIYDSPLRQSQKLLYYATLFFDTNVLYQKYINLSQRSKNLVKYIDIDKLDDLLTARFTCTTKNDLSASSDGFYLYLFKSLVEGGKSAQLYMKVEFNNAKYGKTVPLVCPRYVLTVNGSVTHYQNEVIRFESNDFPLDYQAPSVGENENTYIDTKKLYRDLYIPIIVRYNAKKQQFEWSILCDDQNNNQNLQEDTDNSVVNINLFEARINGYKPAVKPTPANYITFKSNIENSSVGLTMRSTNQTTLQYSMDKEEWIDLKPGNSVPLNTNDEVYVRGILEGDNSLNDFTMFSVTGHVSVSGNLNNIWNYTNLDQQLYERCGLGLFNNCRGLVDASGLTLGTYTTTLASGCYEYMFVGCTSLTTAPELPAITLAEGCYYYMFQGCTSLTILPENMLPATTLASYCYHNMFRGCTSLTTAPALPATILADGCYYRMFADCSSLTTAPALPATTLANDCYYCMFSYCSSLTTAPALPATILADSCYYYMFEDCSNLTTAPALPATTLANGCYNSMFTNCSSLTTLPENMLPATTLASYCYLCMFQGCTSLTTAPELPATTLANSCYNYMFYNCTRLNYIKCLAVDGINTNGSTTNWVSGVANSGVFVKNVNTPTYSSGTDTTGTKWKINDISNIPSGWTVEDDV